MLSWEYFLRRLAVMIKKTALFNAVFLFDICKAVRGT